MCPAHFFPRCPSTLNRCIILNSTIFYAPPGLILVHQRIFWRLLTYCDAFFCRKCKEKVGHFERWIQLWFIEKKKNFYLWKIRERSPKIDTRQSLFCVKSGQKVKSLFLWNFYFLSHATLLVQLTPFSKFSPSFNLILNSMHFKLEYFRIYFFYPNAHHYKLQ